MSAADGAFAYEVIVSVGRRGGAWRAAPFCARRPRAGAARSLRVCNNTHMLLNFAVGVNRGRALRHRGLVDDDARRLLDAVRGPLPGRFVYLYAIDIDAVDVLPGTRLDVRRPRQVPAFSASPIAGGAAMQAVNFAEIDTGGSPDWTAFLNDAAQIEAHDPQLPFFIDFRASSLGNTSVSRLRKSRVASARARSSR